MRSSAIRQLMISSLVAILPTVACGCVRSSYVRDRTTHIQELSREVKGDVEQCREVYDRLKNATVPVASTEPCQAPACGESLPTPAASKCPPNAPPYPKGKPLEQAAAAAERANACANESAQAAKAAKAAVSDARREAYEVLRRSVPDCDVACQDARRRCDRALNEIERVIDAAGELQRKAH